MANVVELLRRMPRVSFDKESALSRSKTYKNIKEQLAANLGQTLSGEEVGINKEEAIEFLQSEINRLQKVLNAFN